MTKEQAKVLIQAWLISQQIINDRLGTKNRIFVEDPEKRNELIDALTVADRDYIMMPAKQQDKSFQKAGETNFKTIWIFRLNGE